MSDSKKEILIPPLKWAGGKRWLLSNYPELFPKKFNKFIEPFLGGASTFFGLKPKSAILSDVNAELINFYKVLRDEPQKLYKEMKKLHKKHSSDFYYEMRSKAPKSDFGKAAQFLYLNRTCWNGLYRVNLKGQFNVPIGTKDTVILKTDDFEGASKALNKAEIKVSDFEDTINLAKEGDFIFADPPYTVKHNMNGFVKYNETLFSWQDQKRLFESLKRASKRGAQVLVSNADHASIRELYEGALEYKSVSRASVLAGSSKFRAKTTELVAIG